MYNRKYKTSNKHSQNKAEKLTKNDLANYCKKLEKLGFLDISHDKNSSERLVSLSSRRQYWQREEVEANLGNGGIKLDPYVHIHDQ